MKCEYYIVLKPEFLEGAKYIRIQGVFNKDYPVPHYGGKSINDLIKEEVIKKVSSKDAEDKSKFPL